MKTARVEMVADGRWNVDGKVRDLKVGEKLTCSETVATDMEKVGHAKILERFGNKPDAAPENKALAGGAENKAAGEPEKSEAQPGAEDKAEADSKTDVNEGAGEQKPEGEASSEQPAAPVEEAKAPAEEAKAPEQPAKTGGIFSRGKKTS